MFVVKLIMLSLCLLLTTQVFAEASPPDPCVNPTAMDRIRPEPRDQPTEVAISMYILDIENVDDINQDFTIDVVINQQWYDPRLINQKVIKQYPYIKCRYELSEVWNPQLTIYNLRNLKPVLDKVVIVKPDGRVNYLQRYFGTLTALMDLKSFPFDHQKFPITLLSTEYGPKDLKLTSNLKDTGHAEHFSIPNWELRPGTIKIGKIVAKSAHIQAISGDFATFEYAFYGSRYLTYYVWKVIIPMSLIVLMSWTVFWVNPKQIEAEVGLAATTILTLIAFLFNLNSLLPKIPYLTNLDFFILFSLILVFLSFIEVILTCSMAIGGRLRQAIYIDRVSRILFPLLYIILLLYFVMH